MGGPTFIPNTFIIQELVRMSLDEHLLNLKGGESPGEPVMSDVMMSPVTNSS